MKAKFFLMFASAAMLLAACSKDDIGSGGDDSGIVTDPKGDAWVSLRVITPSTRGTRALNNPNYQDGSAVESAIHTIRAIFFTEAGVVTDDIGLNPSLAGLDADTGLPTGEAGAAFKVSAESKRILLVANPSPSFPGEGYFSTFSELNEALSDDVSVLASENSGFMMTNAKGGLEPSDEYGNDKNLVLYKTADAANKAPLSINIDRVVAKVHVEIEEKTDTTAVIKNSGWLLNVTNKKYFPVSERIATWNELNNDGFRTPFDKYKLGSYRKDPNYDNQNNGADYSIVTEDPGTWNGSKTYKYCLENTQDSTHNVHAYTTHVLFKINYLPTRYKLYDGSYANINLKDGEDWMLINGGYYTFGTLKDWIKAELTANVAANEGVVPMPLTNAFNRYLGEEGLNIGGISIPTNEEGIETAMQEFGDKQKDIQDNSNRARTVGSFTYYAGGVCYYRAMIRHDDTDKIVNGLGEFGVVRNSYYDILVSKFNNPGYPVIPEPSPEDPDEEEGNWLSIQINVNPWTWYKQVEEF